eukprot:Ihof_evm1s1096 gene=Ihof_evmTU1s1096
MSWNFCPLDGYRFKTDQKLCPICCQLRGRFKGVVESEHGVPWRKVLYLTQPYPDNHTDTSFLAMLRMNPNTRRYNYWALVRESGAISQHISAIAIFGIIFIYSDQGLISDWGLLTTVVILALSFVIWCFVFQDNVHVPSAQGFKGVALAMLFLFGLSPILRTLTSTISTDTIHTMALIALAFTFIATDFSRLPVRQLTGLNEAMFASVCLASRLATSVYAIGLLLITLELFALLPYVGRAYR